MYKEAKKRKNKKAYAAMIGANTAFLGSVVKAFHPAPSLTYVLQWRRRLLIRSSIDCLSNILLCQEVTLFCSLHCFVPLLHTTIAIHFSRARHMTTTSHEAAQPMRGVTRQKLLDNNVAKQPTLGIDQLIELQESQSTPSWGEKKNITDRINYLATSDRPWRSDNMEGGLRDSDPLRYLKDNLVRFSLSAIKLSIANV